MANWEVNEWSNSETTGDNVTAGSMATYVDLEITPHTDYRLSASSFKIGGATQGSGSTVLENTWTGGNVDAEVYKVVFSDTSVVNTLANRVRVRVHFAAAATGGSSWNMPANNKNIYIDIDEKETITDIDRLVCIRSFHAARTDGKGVNKHTVTYATAPANITNTCSTGCAFHNTGDGVVSHTHSGTVVNNPTYPGAQVFQVTFATNTLYGYYYSAPPVVNMANGLWSSYWEVIDSSLTYTSMVVGGVSQSVLTSITYTAYYTPPIGVPGLDPDPGNTGYMCELGQVIEFVDTIRQEDQGAPGRKINVTNVIVDGNDILSTGENRDVTVYGYVDAEFYLQITSSDSSKTYNFSTDTFTAGATTSPASTIPNTGLLGFNIAFPAVTANRTYDIIIIPINPTGTISPPVPLVANDLRLYQYIPTEVSLDLRDGTSGNLWDDAEFPTPIVITGEAGRTLVDGIRKAFSYTITQAMVTAGATDIEPKSTLDFTLDNQSTITTLTDGAASSATHDVDSTVGIIAGNTINWSVDKTPLFSEEAVSEIQIGEAGQGASITIPPNIDNLTVGMILSAPNIRYEDNITITSIGTSSVTISEEITTDTRVDITFTAAGITVGSVTDGNTLVASQSLNLTDNLSLTFGGETSDVSSSVASGTVTQSGDNVIIAGTFIVNSFPIANQTVKMNIDTLINIP